MIIVDPIPGQEERNAQFLIRNGIGVKVKDMNTIGTHVESLLKNPERLNGMRTAALAHGYPQAAKDIARLILQTDV